MWIHTQIHIWDLALCLISASRINFYYLWIASFHSLCFQNFAKFKLYLTTRTGIVILSLCLWPACTLLLWLHNDFWSLIVNSGTAMCVNTNRHASFRGVTCFQIITCDSWQYLLSSWHPSHLHTKKSFPLLKSVWFLMNTIKHKK